MTEHPNTNRAKAAARALARDLAHTLPVAFDGDDGWRAVAERALVAADAAEGPRAPS